MNTILEEMLKRYSAENLYDKRNAIKEIMQEVVLCGLSRAGFFKRAAFYGGTALRIFYGLDRFSEDLDFSLLAEDRTFNLGAFFPVLEKEVKAFGLNVSISEKEKTQDSNIRSAFLKGNTKEHLLMFYPDESRAGTISRTELIKIKFEVDVNPPKYATFEHKYRLHPSPYEIQLYDMPSLFAGKIHAVICRAWQSRVKGRDLYDYVFYLTHGAAVNRRHLRERLIQTGYISETEELSLERIKSLLAEKFDGINFEQAKADVLPFIKDKDVLDIWCTDFFKQITEGLSSL
ncbi:MAG: nucleotidyl transferase AbiEii/AbiGii toxin family protein [Mailhella sp.]|nr:nucleotidyl transferase AbiEii/AbiGii toxin family protein [Mailhella sp.]